MVAWRMQAVVVTVALCIAVIGAVTIEELPNVAVEQDAVQSQTIEDGLAPNWKADAGKHLGAAYGAAMDHLNGMSDKQRKSLATNAALLAVTPMVGPRKLALMYGSYRFRVFMDKYVKQTQENPASNEGLDSIISRATDQLPKDKVAAQAMMFAAEMALLSGVFSWKDVLVMEMLGLNNRVALRDAVISKVSSWLKSAVPAAAKYARNAYSTRFSHEKTQ
ncbi:unnamed protein product (mitochondrion) [Plasmodiophora brassicae]|uniref:Uncharacterized protein n=1 Tax=Plasmodiophora brassicae TaxID=37360 RepID=A0A3P3YLS0_PLABS|nr:unnamed protein product [Plasmodiophora brassicae]